MTDPTFIPEAERELLVVLPDQAAADAARDALLRAGVAEHEIHVGAETDTVAALRAEMHEEFSRSWFVPNAAVVYTKESARGLSILSFVGAGIGIVAAFFFALIDFGWSYWIQFLVFALVGITFGFTIGMVAGPALGAQRPTQAPAGVRGTMLRVSRDTPELRKLLADLDPIRLDEVSQAGHPIATIATEGDDDPVDTAKDIVANADSDDYHETR
ncbi:MAG: hypothetical protein Q8K58_08270 [Acidimicrobiales bacterium]|nr:hypothetical protein [Acidimicrobiales bacterium]